MAFRSFDAWTMFSMWASVNGHIVVATFALGISFLCLLSDQRHLQSGNDP